MADEDYETGLEHLLVAETDQANIRANKYPPYELRVSHRQGLSRSRRQRGG